MLAEFRLMMLNEYQIAHSGEVLRPLMIYKFLSFGNMVPPIFFSCLGSNINIMCSTIVYKYHVFHNSL